MSLRTRKCSRITMLLGVLALAALPATAMAQETVDEPPHVTGVEVTPLTLPYTGGTVTIVVGVTDDFGISSLGLTVYDPNFVQYSVPLNPNENGTWSGELAVPPNFSDNPASYSMEFGVTDTGGNFVMELIGGFEVEAQPVFDEPPLVFDPSVSPTALPSTGGLVTIETSATDLRGISSAYAEITGPGGALSYVDLAGISASRFQGTFTAPANATNAPQTYTVRTGAQDDIGQETWVNAGSFTVAAKPSDGTLTLTPTTVSFGVTRGGVERKSVVLKNTGKKGTAPIEGTLAVTGSALYKLQGAVSGGVPFKLAVGQSKTVVVEFRPLALGTFEGKLVATRLDGRQAGLASRLTGKGR